MSGHGDGAGTSGALARFVPRQRWFGAADRAVRAVVVEQAEAVAPGVDWLVVAVAFEDGGPLVHLQLFWDGSADVVDRPEVVAWLLPTLAVGGQVGVLAGEQSNTSLVVGDDVIVKVFRRLTAERNPDVEVVRALWDVGFRALPEPLAESTRRIDVESTHLAEQLARAGVDDSTDRGAAEGSAGGAASGRAAAGLVGEVDLAVARRFLRGATDGWEMATADLSAFPERAAALGEVTAEMHLALARAFGAAPGDGVAWAEAMAAQLRRTPGLERAEDLSRRYQRLAAAASPGPAVRTHGDYHLGQVLWRDGSWFVLDFEGEPARPVAERVVPTSPLKDVAGMLRSFGYAVAVAGGGLGDEDRLRRAFLDGYLAVEGIAALLPADLDLVLGCFELDKAVYEVAYERSHRPSWASIPLGALERLLGS